MTHSLLPEDGATFHAQIDAIEEGASTLFRASYCVQLDLRSHVDMETPDMEVFETNEQARTWLHQRAAARGFKRILWKD
jgi:hypothetical protein